MEPERLHLQDVDDDVPHLLPPVRDPVEEVVEGEERETGGHPDGAQLQRPPERHAVEVAEEERRVSQGGEAAADVRDEEDEEDDRVHLVAPLPVGPHERPDEEHARARGADEARQDRPRREEPGVDGRRGAEIAGEVDASRDRVEGEEEGDEREVVLEDGPVERVPRGRRPSFEEGVDDGRAAQDQRHEELVPVPVPEAGQARHEREDRDHEEQGHEGQEGDDREGQERYPFSPAARRRPRPRRRRRRSGWFVKMPSTPILASRSSSAGSSTV